jgi:hypothetical protein
MSGGICLVNWPTVSRPKNIGGLGVVDLERFARALRIRWMWFQWRDRDMAWTGLDTHVPKKIETFFMLQLQ